MMLISYNTSKYFFHKTEAITTLTSMTIT